MPLLGKKHMQDTTGCVPGLDWVDMNFECSTVGLINLPGLMGIWQKWLRWWDIQIKVNPTQVHNQMGHPVHGFLFGRSYVNQILGYTLECHPRALSHPGLALPHSGPGRAHPHLDLTKVDRMTIGARREKETGTECACATK